MKLALVGQNFIGGEVLNALIKEGILPDLIITRIPNDYPNLVDEIAKEHEIEVFHSGNINNAETLEKLNEVNPDFIFCAAWGQRFKSKVLDSAKCINFHPSLLPKYQGSSPIIHQIINGEKYCGCSTHFMTQEFDKGAIILQNRFKIEDTHNSADVRRNSGKYLGILAIDTYRALEKDHGLIGHLPDYSEGSYQPPRDNNFLVDYENTNWLDFDRLVRAYAPYPCIIVEKNSKKYRIEKVSLLEKDSIENENSFTLNLKDAIVRVDKHQDLS